MRGNSTTIAKYKSPEMTRLKPRMARFCQQASCIFDGPLHEKEDGVKRTLIQKKKKVSKNYPLCVLIEIKHVKEDEEFYVTAEIKDSQVRFQLDSGAKPNVMSAKVY
ncbi:unnamed protein product, partial [Porites lobata]